MSVEETQHTLQRDLDALPSGGDFAAFFAADVEWTTMETGEHVRGREAVFVGRQTAEFGGVPPTGASVRMPYAVFYDVSGDRIDALRACFPVRALVEQLQDAAAASTAGTV